MKSTLVATVDDTSISCLRCHVASCPASTMPLITSPLMATTTKFLSSGLLSATWTVKSYKSFASTSNHLLFLCRTGCSLFPPMWGKHPDRRTFGTVRPGSFQESLGIETRSREWVHRTQDVALPTRRLIPQLLVQSVFPLFVTKLFQY